MRGLLVDIAELSKVECATTGQHALRPSSAWPNPARSCAHFARHPDGPEVPSLILALLQTGGHPPKVEQAVIDQIKALPASSSSATFISQCATTARTWCRPST